MKKRKEIGTGNSIGWRNSRGWSTGSWTGVINFTVRFAVNMTHCTGTYITGNGSFKVHSTRAHDQSSGHQVNLAEEEAEKEKPGTSKAHQILNTLNATQFERLGKLYRNVHALCLKARPYTDFVWIAQLDRAKGLDVGHSYINHQRATEFAHFIAEATRVPIIEKLKTVKFVSLMSDGSTDTSAQEAELVYSRAGHRGVVTTAFVGVVNIERADASGILGSLSTAMSGHMKMEPETWQKKIVGFGCDGASVNLGKKTAVIARLKETQPEVQGIHCMAHRWIPSKHPGIYFYLHLPWDVMCCRDSHFKVNGKYMIW